jgi:hypothetical protein
MAYRDTIDYQDHVGEPPPPPKPPTPLKEADMLVLQLNTWDGGGLHGVCYAIAPGALYVCRDYPEAEQLAAVWNPDKAIISISDMWMNSHLDAQGIPRELLYAGGGVNWSWAKDAANNTKPKDAL